MKKLAILLVCLMAGALISLVGIKDRPLSDTSTEVDPDTAECPATDEPLTDTESESYETDETTDDGLPDIEANATHPPETPDSPPSDTASSTDEEVSDETTDESTMGDGGTSHEPQYTHKRPDRSSHP